MMHFVDMDVLCVVDRGRFWAVFGHRKFNFTEGTSDRPSRHDRQCGIGHGRRRVGRQLCSAIASSREDLVAEESM